MEDIDSEGIEEEVAAILGFEIGVGKEIADLGAEIEGHYNLMYEGWEETFEECGERRLALMEIAGVWVRSVLMIDNIDEYRDIMMQLIPLLRLSEVVGLLIDKNKPKEDGHGNDNE